MESGSPGGVMGSGTVRFRESRDFGDEFQEKRDFGTGFQERRVFEEWIFYNF